MDEPFSSLDPSLRKEMGQLVKTLQRQMKLTVIFVTHDVSEALRLSDEILLLKEGRVLETGTPDALYERPQRLETARFMEAGNLINGRVEGKQFFCFLGSFPCNGHAGRIRHRCVSRTPDQPESRQLRVPGGGDSISGQKPAGEGDRPGADPLGRGPFPQQLLASRTDGGINCRRRFT
jgi:hypothetical protein